MSMVHWLREPLLHFLIAGTVMFGGHAWVNDWTGMGVDNQVVRITAGQVEWLAQTWTRQWGRPPTHAELKEIVGAYLKEVLLAREARALNLDENDTVVRRRLAQKMEFLVQDTAQMAEPTEEELHRFFVTHRERFRSPARITFTHVYFNRDRRGIAAEADARAALERLSRARARASDLGDRFLASYDFIDADAEQVASVLGSEFSRRVFTIEPGGWRGPMKSSYGLHVVRVTGKQDAQLREFATVRDEVLTLWREQREQEHREQYFAALFKRYDVEADESIRPLVGPLVAAGREK